MAEREYSRQEETVKQWLKRRFPRLHKASRVLRGHPVIFLSYPVRASPRSGYGAPPHRELHSLLDGRRGEYRKILSQFKPFFPELQRIPRAGSPGEPSWVNRMMPPLDSAALYSLLRIFKPRLYLEIGSGYSTKIARRAIRDGNLGTQILSIDPHPRSDVDAICDQVMRKALENMELAIFGELACGDILFFDGSHCCYTNSDVAVFFLEVLPQLKPGVIVQIHDIALPYDYPPHWNERFYSEQYLLACCLLTGAERYEVLLPNYFVSEDTELSAELQELWRQDLAGLEPRGMSFWLRIHECVGPLNHREAAPRRGDSAAHEERRV